MTTIFKDLFLSNSLANQSQNFVVPPLGGGKNVYINGPGHNTKMAATPYMVRPFKISSYITNGPMTMKLCMEYYELKLYTVYINDDSELTLTYFTTMSNLSKLVLYLY